MLGQARSDWQRSEYLIGGAIQRRLYGVGGWPFTDEILGVLQKG